LNDDDEAYSESEQVFTTKFCSVQAIKELNRRFVDHEYILRGGPSAAKINNFLS